MLAQPSRDSIYVIMNYSAPFSVYLLLLHRMGVFIVYYLMIDHTSVPCKSLALILFVSADQGNIIIYFFVSPAFSWTSLPFGYGISFHSAVFFLCNMICRIQIIFAAKLSKPFSVCLVQIISQDASTQVFAWGQIS